MTKLLNLVKFFLLLMMIILNFLIFRKGINLTRYKHLLYLIFIGLFLVLSIKDLIKKDSINRNKVYNVLSIIVFLIIIVILLRALYDPHFVYNDSIFMKTFDEYTMELYGSGNYSDDSILIQSFIRQNMNYFIAMFMLLFTYRFINKDKKKSDD